MTHSNDVCFYVCLFDERLHVDNGRMLFLGWFNVGASALTAPREVVYDAEMEALRLLPVDELKVLRGTQLAKHVVPVTLKGGGFARLQYRGHASIWPVGRCASNHVV